ncbi:uncharacterized protein LOC124898019 [Capsicum annuum]|uniref:uncharacterized protein LOC124898019 n=1 Tax=Capsicum annuum TaxID=4072 RepID=UPI001FB106A7|nr:uncharacterized protein LOC124898019 [Capsicum annuum]
MVQEVVRSSLGAEIRERQVLDPILIKIKNDVGKKQAVAFEISGDGTLRCQVRLCVTNVDGLQQRVLAEVHESRYAFHPNSTIMYHDIKDIYWWNGIKKNVADYMAKCMVLNGRRCRSPIEWLEVKEEDMFVLDLVYQAIEKFKVIRDWLIAIQSFQKSYTDVRHRELEFKIRDRVFLNVSPR